VAERVIWFWLPTGHHQEWVLRLFGLAILAERLAVAAIDHPLPVLNPARLSSFISSMEMPVPSHGAVRHPAMIRVRPDHPGASIKCS
jgi:hypothetical protein